MDSTGSKIFTRWLGRLDTYRISLWLSSFGLVLMANGIGGHVNGGINISGCLSYLAGIMAGLTFVREKK